MEKFVIVVIQIHDVLPVLAVLETYVILVWTLLLVYGMVEFGLKGGTAMTILVRKVEV